MPRVNTDDSLPDETVDGLASAFDALEGGQYTATVRAPDGVEGELTTPVKRIDAVRDATPSLGAVARLDVELDMDRDEWKEQLSNENGTRPRDYAAPIFHAMEQAGVTRPEGTPLYGVKTTRVHDGGRVEPAVIVQGYVPLPDTGRGLASDGGRLSMIGGRVWDSLAMYGEALPPLLAMARILTDIGEEYTMKNNLDGITLSVGLYDDASGTASPASGGDAVGDTADYDWTNPNVEKRGTSITTEPTGASYSFQTEAASVSDLSGDWGVSTDTDTVFDTSDSATSVDSWYAGISFQSSDTSDTSAENHLLCTGALSQAYEFPGVTELTINAGGVGWTLD